MPKTVLTTGTFDLLHPGHVALLGELKTTFPDHNLVVGINGDRRAREIKETVLFSAHERASILKAIRFVDRVVVFEEDDPSDLIRWLKPDVFAKGPDWRGKEIVEMAACQEVGCMVAFIGTKTHNSSDLKRMLSVERS